MTNPTDDRHTYTPNMEKLKADLGRTPPSMVDQSKPVDYAPKPKPEYSRWNWEAELAQRIKDLMREHNDWQKLGPTAREGLDLIASRMAGICVGRDYWEEIIDHATVVTKQDQQT